MRGALASIVAAATAVACSPESGVLELRVLDDAGLPTPARIEIVDAAGHTHLPDDALQIKLECWTTPLPEWAAGVRNVLQTARSIGNPYTGRTQFYVDGQTRAALPAGRYHLTAEKGIEYRRMSREFDVAEDQTTRVELALQRWIDMPRRGWISADDHLHITRLTPEDDRLIARWMRAEDLHVANLLRMGTAEHFAITPQYAFGDTGVHRDGQTLLLAGQEHPRTHVLGHTIILGAETAIDRRDSYTAYRGFWEEAARRDGASGYAHWGAGQARNGLAVDAPTGLLSFVEVLQFDLPYYDVWYELLNLGVRLAPTAGTDFPCIPSIPGRERFYTRAEGTPGPTAEGLPGPTTEGLFNRAGWVEGVRRGRTFVTNGPMLELALGDVEIGETLELDAPRAVRVRGAVRFDPERDDVHALELIRDGQRAALEVRRSGPGEIVLETTANLRQPGWFALRASGEKVGELPMETPWFMRPRALELGCRFGCGASIFERGEFVGAGRPRPSAAHTAPIYVALAGAEVTPSPELVRRWLEQLDQLEARLSDERLDELLVLRPFASVLLIDGVPEEALRRDRSALRELIASARRHYQALLAAAD